MNARRDQTRIVLGAFVVLIGLFALADNLFNINTRQVLQFWPVVFMVIGLMKLSNTRHAEGLTKQVDQMQAFGKEVENRLVRSGQLGINLQYFYKLEAENEVKLLDVRQGLPSKTSKGLYVGIPYTLSVQGSFKQVGAFLQHLENGPHFCRFTTATYSKSASASVDAPGGAAGGVTLNLTLELLGLP